MPPKKAQAAVQDEFDSSEQDELSESESNFDENVALEYKPRNKLEEPRNKTLSVEILYAMLHCGDIDLEPEYQRGFVWPGAKQINLIDSLYRNFYIPPVIFHKIIDRQSDSEKFVCIDGKQRLTSIQRFIDGFFPHVDQSTGIKYWSPKAMQGPNANKVKGKILSDAVIHDLYKKQIVCIEYSNLTGIQEREIFHRIQMGMPLSSAEKMAAISSKRTEFAHKIEDKMSDWPDTVKMTGDRKRMFQNIAHVLRALSTIPKITTPTTISLDKWLREPDGVDDAESIEEDFDIIIRIAIDHGSVAFPPAMSLKLSPVEFIFSVILVHIYKATLKQDQMAAAIRDMRRFVRAQHSDIRTNSVVSKTLEEFVVNEMENKISSNAYGSVKRSETPGQGVTKRKRAEEGDDEDYADDVMDTREDGKRASPRKRRGGAAPDPQNPLFFDTPTKKSPNVAMKLSPPPSRNNMSPTATAPTSNSNSSRADSANRTPGTRTALSGAIAPVLTRRGGWGSGLHSLVGSFKGNQ